MANPYDFSSGYLAARKIRNEEQERKDRNAYLTGMLGVYQEDSNLKSLLGLGTIAKNDEELKRLKNTNAMMEKFMPFIDEAFKDGTFGFKFNPPNNQNGIKNPNEMAPFAPGGSRSSANPTMEKTSYSPEVDSNGYGINPEFNPENLIEAADGGYVRPLRFVDGGMLDEENIARETQRQYGIQTPAETAYMPQGSDQSQNGMPGMMMVAAKNSNKPPAPSSGQTLYDSSNSEFQKFAQEDPEEAMNLYKKISNYKNQSKLIAGMAMIDWASQRTTSKDLLGTVESLKQIQREGVYEAVSKFEQGDIKGGIRLYKQFGEDGDLSTVNKRTIKELDPTSPKGAMRERHVYDMTFASGEKATLDPFHLALDTLSAKARLEKVDKDKDFQLRESAQDIQSRNLGYNNQLRQDGKDRELLLRMDQTGAAELKTVESVIAKQIQDNSVFKTDSKARMEYQVDQQAALSRARELFQLGVNEYANSGFQRQPPSARAIYEALVTGRLDNGAYMPRLPQSLAPQPRSGSPFQQSQDSGNQDSGYLAP
jgi:hypothetical protein